MFPVEINGLGVVQGIVLQKIRRGRMVYVIKVVAIGWNVSQQLGLNHVDWKRCRSFKIK